MYFLNAGIEEVSHEKEWHYLLTRSSFSLIMYSSSCSVPFSRESATYQKSIRKTLNKIKSIFGQSLTIVVVWVEVQITLN